MTYHQPNSIPSNHSSIHLFNINSIISIKSQKSKQRHQLSYFFFLLYYYKNKYSTGCPMFSTIHSDLCPLYGNKTEIINWKNDRNKNGMKTNKWTHRMRETWSVSLAVCEYLCPCCLLITFFYWKRNPILINSAILLDCLCCLPNCGMVQWNKRNCQ